MNRIYMLVTFLFICGSVYKLGYAGMTYGTQWEFGAYYTPKALLSADMMTYRDGSPISDFARAIVLNGREVEAGLFVYFGAGFCLSVIGWLIYSTYRTAHSFALFIQSGVESGSFTKVDIDRCPNCKDRKPEVIRKGEFSGVCLCCWETIPVPEERP